MSEKMPTRYLEVIRPKSRLAAWAWSPIIVLRISLASTYLLWVYASAIAFIWGVPVLDLTTPHGWTPIWAFLLGTAAVLSAIGSITDRWQRLERWATLVLSAMVLSYAGAMNLVAWLDFDLTRQFAGAIAIIASLLPVTRFVYLAAQSGKRKIDDVPVSG